MNTFRLPNTTALHVHGMHVSPSGAADNMFEAVAPGETREYVYDIPYTHYFGVFWYHPHFHGSSTLQMLGMAGAILVEPRPGSPDAARLPALLTAMPQTIMVVQQVGLAAHQHTATMARSTMPLEVAVGEAEKGKTGKTGKKEKREGVEGVEPPAFFTINGQLRPVLTMKSGEWNRWRIVHAGLGELLLLRVTGCEVHELGRDGVLYDAPRRRSRVLVPAGSRADLAVRCIRGSGRGLTGGEGRPGGRSASSEEKRGETKEEEKAADEETSWDFQLSSGGPSDPSPAVKRVIGESTAVYQGPLMRIVLDGERHTTLPVAPLGGVVQSERTPLLQPLMHTAVPAEGRYDFSWTKGAERVNIAGGYNYSTWGINGEPFRGAGHVARRVRLGTVEEWSVGGGSGVSSQHPFHVHVNHFQIIRVDGVGAASGDKGGHAGEGDDYYDFQVGDWRDTIVVPMGRRVVVRWRADDFTGKSLGHCHVFAHSDQGMVMVFEIVGPYLLR